MGVGHEYDSKKECVAALFAEGLWPVTGKGGMVERCDVTPQTIYKWKKDPTFEARIEELREEAKEAVKHLFLSQRENRLKLYDQQARRLLRLQEAREKAYADDKEVVGGDTGVIVKKKVVKKVRNKDENIITVEHAYDPAVDRELRELAKQAAIEQGQWSEKRELTGADGSPFIPIVEVVIDRSAGDE